MVSPAMLKGMNTEIYGEGHPFGDPSWYQAYNTPYYNDTHKQFRKLMREYVDEHIMSNVHDWDEKGTIPKEMYLEAGKQGTLALCIGRPWPEKYFGPSPWGFEPDYFHELIMYDEMSRTGSVGFQWGVAGGTTIGLPPVYHHGSEELKNRVMPPCVKGEKVCCLAITEPTAGSDVANLKCTAKLEGDYYILNGEKKWITNGIFADYFTVACRTGKPGVVGISLLLVEKGMEGLETRKMKCSGAWSSGTTYITFDDVKVPKGNLLGKEGWTRTVVILLAKPTGGTRPISLTGICWRMGATALVRQLHTWTNTWLPSNMVGGIAGRHAAYLHARLHHAIAQNRHGHLTVLSQDLTKAFDSIHIQQALSILHHFGAPTNITQLILHFYNTCQRTFSFGGCVHPHWHTATHGIPQGCPFSPLLLNTVMTIWAHALHQHPQLHTGIFFDDRSVWATGPQAATHIAQAIHTSHTIDAKLGFTENQSKTQIAAANHTQRHITDATVPAGYPPASSTFKLLGLRYDLAAAKPVTIDPEAIARYEARTRRLPLVTRRFPWRRLHLRTLAFPIITWGGTFASPAPKQLARMRTACARTIIGWLPRGSSKHNLWTTTLQPQDDLEYNFLHQALSTLTWITRARETPTPWQQQTHYPFLSQDPQQWAPPLKAALRALKWTWHNDTTHSPGKTHMAAHAGFASDGMATTSFTPGSKKHGPPNYTTRNGEFGDLPTATTPTSPAASDYPNHTPTTLQLWRHTAHTGLPPHWHQH